MVRHRSPPPPANVVDPPTPENEEDNRELLEVAERRRAISDSFAWTVPGLAVAGEAFLLSIALASSTEPAGRVVAAVAGMLVVVGALHFIAKQAYNFNLYDALIERQRTRLGRMSMHRETIEDLDLPAYVALQRRPPRWFSKNLRAILLWRFVLGALLLIDVLILAYAICEWSGADPGWLRDDSTFR